ncbi:hypothetical protein ACS0TY_028945 [Phlomoides rotata]
MAILQSPLQITRSDYLCPNSHFFSLPSKRTLSSRHRPFVITFSSIFQNRGKIWQIESLFDYVSESKSGTVDNEKNRKFLEQYGLNPDDFLPKSSPKMKKRRERGTEMAKDAQLEEPKPPRETHKLLQVLGGTARRKKLLSPKGMDVRPMMEVVKGAAFSILQAAGGCTQSLRPGRWLDLYSGTGSVGIEAISRGCSEVHFVEMDPWVISDVLRPNLESTGFLDVSVIHTSRVETFLKNAERFVGD